MKTGILIQALMLLAGPWARAQQNPIPTPQWRPVYHFTPLRNWTNDPNGLIYLNGEFHLYNQQNPYANQWGHMSWGHAVSQDLVHWKHLPLAIPEIITKDGDTTWIFSGSAIWDEYNRSGLCKKGGCLMAIYTSDQPNLKRESQFLAFSQDGGLSFTNYKNNPILDLNKRDFRDPNVSWNGPLNRWLMVVALPKEHKVQFYSSENLIHWELLSEFGPEGFIRADWECPFFVELPVDGRINQKEWVLAVSAGGPDRGPFIQYFVGHFDGRQFKNDNPASTVLSVDFGDCFYAAIPWNDLPGDRKTFIGWLAPAAGPTYPWKGQMSIPRDLKLRNTGQGARLFQSPCGLISHQLSQLSGNRTTEVQGLVLNNQEKGIVAKSLTQGNSYWIRTELTAEAGAIAGFKIVQKKTGDPDSVSEVVLGFDPTKNQVFLDRRKVNSGETRKSAERQTVDLPDKSNHIKLEILLDKSSLEVFVNGGEEVLSAYIFPDKDASGLSAYSVGGIGQIKSFRIWDLSNIKQPAGTQKP
jgi:fructan beta-fructosidase